MCRPNKGRRPLEPPKGTVCQAGAWGLQTRANQAP